MPVHPSEVITEATSGGKLPGAPWEGKLTLSKEYVIIIMSNLDWSMGSLESLDMLAESCFM